MNRNRERREGNDTREQSERGMQPESQSATLDARPTMPLRWVLLSVVGVYVALAGLLALTQPMDLGTPAQARVSPPDESAHMAYFDELTTAWRLPVFTSGTGNYEAHQPPLYYVALSPLYLVAGVAGRATAIVVLRLASVALGAVSVVLIWRLALLALPASALGAAAATVIAALWPARVVACAGVSNDPAAELSSLLALLWACRLAQDRPSARGAFLTGLLVGVAMLVKSSALPLVLVGMAALYLAARFSDAPNRDLLVGLGAFLGGVVLLWGPWATRNTILYGDPMAMAVFQRIFTQDRATPEYFLQHGFTGLQYYGLVAWQTALSFWGVLGQANLWLPAWYYLLGGAWWALALGLGLAKLLVRPEALRPWPRQTWALLALHLVLTVALFLRFNAVFYQAQARYFLPASAVLGLFLARPWIWPRRTVLAVLGLGLFVLLALGPPLLSLAGLTSPVFPFSPAP